jgi:hypothetical protein
VLFPTTAPAAAPTVAPTAPPFVLLLRAQAVDVNATAISNATRAGRGIRVGQFMVLMGCLG